MYKVLLVDDEDLIREAISKKLNWAELGFELMGTCRNGKDAMEFVDNNPIDLLITDICMPYVDGIQLSKYVYEKYPDIKIIILSGYNDFDYAKNAMKYRVLEYVLKPVTFSELSEMLTRLKESFKEEQEKKANMDMFRDEYRKNFPILRVRFLNQLVHGQQKEIEEDEIKARLEDFNSPLSGCYYKVVMIEEDTEKFIQNNNGLKVDLPAFIIYNITEEIVRTMETGITFQNLHNKTVIIFCEWKKDKLEEKIEEVFTKVHDILNRYYEIGVTFGLGKLTENLSNLKFSYQGAESVLEYRFLYGNNVMLDISDFNKLKQEKELDLSEAISNLVLAIKINTDSDIKKFLLEIIDKLKKEKIPKNRIYIYIQNIVISIGNLLKNVDLLDDQAMKEQDQIMHVLYEEKTLPGVEDSLYQFCKKIGEKLAQQRNSFSSKQAVLAMNYIEKNYSNENLSLQSICNELSISSSYFSSIFKSHTGETFIEALTKMRISKAKELLDNTSMKNYEIAEKVGFSDPHYFALTFKKYTGMTPKEYAKKETN